MGSVQRAKAIEYSQRLSRLPEQAGTELPRDDLGCVEQKSDDGVIKQTFQRDPSMCVCVLLLLSKGWLCNRANRACLESSVSLSSL